MVKDFLKFIEKSPYKGRLLVVIEDIYHDQLTKYDVKPLQGKQATFRIRVGTIRVIFIKTSTGNKIIEINNRGDIY